MSRGVPRSEKRAPKRMQIVNELRRRIVAGQASPGEQLPPRVQLEHDFAASSRTVQDALDVLAEEGFVLSRPGQGTFVAESPPHLSRYGLVFGPDSTGSHGAAFTAALRRQIPIVEKERNCRFAIYENVTSRADTAEYQQLLRDIEAHRVAGLIFRGDVHKSGLGLSDTPFVTTPGIPRVIFTMGLPDVPGAAGVRTDGDAFIDRALDDLHGRGRRRVALISKYELPQDQVADFLARVQHHGMTVKPHWILYGAGNQMLTITQLLLLLPEAERPDAVIISSEDLIEHVSAGIIASGARPGHDLDVVAHSHLPCVSSPLIPMRRLGGNMHERLLVSLDLLDRQSRGETVPPCVVLQPAFEDEVAAPVVPAPEEATDVNFKFRM